MVKMSESFNDHVYDDLYLILEAVSRITFAVDSLSTKSEDS